MIRLPDVTLLTATSVGIDEAHDALLYCARRMQFGAVKLLSPEPPFLREAGVEYVQIAPMDFAGYSRFMIEQLDQHVSTSHCLVIQADGFILDPAHWQDDFLQYDYIGAPWEPGVGVNPGSWILWLDRNRVGNGGFSLRSKKLTRATAALHFDALDFPVKTEDILICHYLYDHMLAAGIRFAPLEVAARFAIDAGLPGQSINTVFGFHGKQWLPVAYAKTGRRAPQRPTYHVTWKT